MPTYEVRLAAPALASVTIEVRDEVVARGTAAEMFAQWARSLSADDFEAKRQLQRPDDTGDGRSEARYTYSDADAQTEQAEAARWATESVGEGTEA